VVPALTYGLEIITSDSEATLKHREHKSYGPLKVHTIPIGICAGKRNLPTGRHNVEMSATKDDGR
jgi:hypothetical protein